MNRNIYYGKFKSIDEDGDEGLIIVRASNKTKAYEKAYRRLNQSAYNVDNIKLYEIINEKFSTYIHLNNNNSI